MSEETVPVTVFHHRTSRRVLYLECQNDFAVILANFSIVPLGALLQLLENADLGELNKSCLRSLYVSLGQLDRNSFTNPSVPHGAHPFFKSSNNLGYELNRCVVFIVRNDLSIVKSSSGVVLELLRSAKIGNTELEGTVINVTKKMVLQLLLAAINLSSEPLTEVFGPPLEENRIKVTVTGLGE